MVTDFDHLLAVAVKDRSNQITSSSHVQGAFTIK